MEADLHLLRGLASPSDFVEVLNRELESVLTTDYWNITLPNVLATASLQSPAMSAFFAALCILDAPVLYSRMKVRELLDPTAQGIKNALERHHLFPRRCLQRIGIRERRDINQVANFALIEWNDNVSISDKPPTQYVPVIEARFSSHELQEMYDLHALPERWYIMDYYQFLEERRRLMAGVIRRGFEALATTGTASCQHQR